MIDQREKTYSAPFAAHLFSKETVVLADGRQVREYPRLQYAGSHLQDPTTRQSDIGSQLLVGLAWGLGVGALLFLIAWSIGKRFWTGVFLLLVAVLVAEATVLSQGYHILGTDKTGRDVFYIALKSVRTGLIIGTLTTLIVTPFRYSVWRARRVLWRVGGRCYSVCLFYPRFDS